MVNINELTVGQAKELSSLFNNKKKQAPRTVCGELRIVVLQRGWVLVGMYHASGNECRLEDSFVIRRWGTSEGLGELAAKGPLPETKLDPSGICKFHRSAEVLTLDCDISKWSSYGRSERV